jgi:hypothetical protein
MDTRELVNALASGDSIAIDNSFNSVMSQKISSALDNYRVQVAQNLFPEEQEQEQEEQEEDADAEEA